MITRHIGKIPRFLMLLISALAAFGCGEEKEISQGPTVLRIQADNQRPNAFQTSVKVNVSCDISWSADLSDKSWAKIENLVRNEGTGGSFTVTLTPNTGKDPRELVVKVTAGQGSTTATITQEGLDSFFKPSTITLSGTTAFNVNFTSPYDWTAEIASGEEWLTLRTKSGKAGSAVLTCLAKDDNRNVGSREGAIRVKIGTVSVEIPVVQGQKDVILGEDSGTLFDWKGGPFTVHTQSNVDYQIDCGADWIEHTATRALNEATEDFLVKPNENSEDRSAVIRFTGGNGITLSFKVNQYGKDPLLNITQPGFYGVGGMNYISGEGGWNQTGRKTGTDGTVTFRLMNRAELSVVMVEGILPSAKVGSKLDVTFRLLKKSKTVLQGTYEAQVIDTSDEQVWLKAGSDVCFVVKK